MGTTKSKNAKDLKAIFAGKAVKLEKVGPTLESFNRCPSLPSVATGDRKQFQYLTIVLNDKPGPLVLEFSQSEHRFSAGLKKIVNSLT